MYSNFLKKQTPAISTEKNETLHLSQMRRMGLELELIYLLIFPIFQPFMWGFPKMVVFPNKPMGFPTKSDHDLGCVNGVFYPPFKETPMDR